MSPSLLSRSGKLGLSMILLLPLYGQDDPLDNLVAKGREFQAQGQFAQAEATFRAALQQAERRTGEPLVAAALLDCLASNASDQARFGDAERLYLRALSSTDRVGGADSKASATILWHMAAMYAEAGQMAAAEPLMAKYQSIILRYPDKDPSVAAAELGNVGRIYAYKHSMKKALSVFERALTILRGESNPDPVDMVRALLDEAAAMTTVHEVDSAIVDVERARAWLAKLQRPAQTLEIDLNLTAGYAYAHAHRTSDAKSGFERAMQITQSSYGLTHPVLALILREYSQALRLLGDKKEASAVASRAKRIDAANGQMRTLGYGVDIRTLRP